MIFRAFYYLDIAGNSSDKAKAKYCEGLASVMTPLVKGYGSEMSLGVIAEAMQVMGGVGYTAEYPIEQSLRDSKVLTIWEGTTFIHGNDLVSRKMRMDGGATFNAWLTTICSFIDSRGSNPHFAGEMERLKKGYGCVEDMRSLYNAWYANTDEKKKFIRTMTICSQVQVAQCLLEQAMIAAEKLEGLPEGHFDRSFYEGKVASARYYVNQVLPTTFMLSEMMKSEDRVCLDCPEDALVVM
jgi:hypothetical protein